MFLQLAQLCYTRLFVRHALFLVCTLITLGVLGYHFGTFDQFVHIAFLKKYADPTLYANDAFINAMWTENYSYFWYLFVPFRRAGILEPVLFGVYVLTTYLAFWKLWDLSLLLFNYPPAALLSTLAFAMPHLGFAGFPIFEFSLLNRTFALPFTLWILIFYLKKRYGLAFALAGLLFNFHVLSVNFVMAMMVGDLGLRFLQDERAGGEAPLRLFSPSRANTLFNLVSGFLIFLLLASPVLLWRFTSPAAEAELNPEWFSVVARGSLFNLFYLISPHVHIIFVTLSGLSTLALYFLARRKTQAHSPEHERSIRNFLVVVVVILAVQAVTVLIYPINIINQLQVIRVGMWATIFSYLYFGHYIVQRWQAGRWQLADTVTQAAAYVISPLPFAPLVVWGLLHWERWRRARIMLSLAVLGGLLAVSIGIVLNLRLWQPGIAIYGPNTTWEQIQMCARAQTPKEAVFLVPPEKWWLYTSEWRVFSERSTVVTHSELLMIALAPTYYDEWKNRFVEAAPGVIEKFDGDFFANQRMVKEAFYRLPPEAWLRLAHTYRADYIVLEQPHTLDLPALNCGNPDYTIYEVIQ